MDGTSVVYEKDLSFSKITLHVLKAGDDYSITILGGDKQHIGSSVLSVPRPSLTGDGSVSVTSSMMNMIGHKDEQICRYVAEKVCIKKNAVVLCSGGFHIDDITKEQIKEVLQAVKELVDEI
ncbi:prenylated flavin chaperone LpdD [Intestinibacter sp.]